jgi:hypothetical protein
MELSAIKVSHGVAGQLSASATVTYEGEEPSEITFVGSHFGGPVVMVSGGHQTFVTDPQRFGAFEKDPKEWVRHFFA